MARLPQPGSDNGTWGDILNEFLSQSLAPSGELKPDSVGATQLQPNSVTNNAIAPNTITNAELASNAVNAAIIADGSITEILLDSSLQAKINASATVSSVNTKTGAVTLDKSDIGLANVDNTSDADKNSASATLTNKTLTSPKLNEVLDTNNAKIISLTSAANAVNYVDIVNSSTTNAPQIRALGSDTNVALYLRAKGNGSIALLDGNQRSILYASQGSSNAQNYILVNNAGTGSPPSVGTWGADANVDLNLTTKGTGTVKANGVEVATISGSQTLTNKTLTNPRINSIRDTTNGTMALAMGAAASAVNYLYAYGDNTGAPPQLAVFGSDTDIDMMLVPKGSGRLRIYATTGNTPTINAYGPDNNINLNITTKGNGVLQTNGVEVSTISSTQTLTNKTLSNGTLSGNSSIPQSGNLYLYNTTDQTTNYERLRQYWSSNTAYITTESGGTGTARSLYLGVGGAIRGLLISGAPTSQGRFQFTENTTLSNGVGALLSNNFSATSGTNIGLSLSGTISQSGTAGYTSLLINPTESSTGSGTKLLADFQIGGTSKTRIDNTGTHILSTGAGITLYNTSDETTNYERVRQYWSSNTYTVITESGGTGTSRNMQIQAGSTAMLLQGSGGVQIFRNSTGISYLLNVTSTGLTASSATQYGLTVNPVINQSGTAGYTALLVNPSETATGSGSKRLLDVQVGSSTKFNIDNAGILNTYATSTNAVNFNNTLTDLSGTVLTANVATTFNPASTSSAQVRSLNLSVLMATSQTLTGTVYGGWFESRWQGSGSASSLVGARANVVIPAAAVNFGTISNVSGLEVQGVNEFASTAITSGTVTNARGIYIVGHGKTSAGMTITNAIGLDIAAQTNGSSLNIGLRIDKSNSYAMQLMDTGGTAAGGITFGTDTNIYRSAANTLKTDDNLIVSIAGTVSGSVATIDGTQTLTNKAFGDNLNMGSHRITSVTDPTNPQDAATKNYVDTNTVSATGTATLTNKTLTNPKINQVQDTSGYDILGLYGIASAVNKFYLTNQSTTNYPTFGVDGSDTNIGMTLAPKGTGTVRIYANTGITPTLDVGGPDTNIDLNLRGQGSGIVKANGVPVATQVVTPPATAISTGIAGQIAYDSNYFYQCVATNTWKRSALSSW